MNKKERIQKIILVLKKNYGHTMLASLSDLDAFKILIATILSARSKDEQTEPIAKSLFKEYGTVRKLANADASSVEKIIRGIGFYKVKTKYIIETSKLLLSEFKGQVPDDYERLMKLHGVGRKVAGCVLVYAFGQAALPVDVHVHRISNRLGWVKTKDPEKTEVELLRLVPKKQWFLVNDVLVHHGKTVCAPISPFCSKCSIYSLCSRVGVEKSR